MPNPEEPLNAQAIKEIFEIHRDLRDYNKALLKNQAQSPKLYHLVLGVALFASGAVTAYFDGISKAKNHADAVIKPIADNIARLQEDVYDVGIKLERMSVLLEERHKLGYNDANYIVSSYNKCSLIR